MALRTRDQADLVDALVSFHLNAGVDFVIATDHRSRDGTVEVLEAYAREGFLHLVREDGEQVRGAEWRTRMARMAATEYGADWVINGDGDEFWWPRHGRFGDLLDAVPERFGVARCVWRPFLPRLDEETFFAERMTIRLAPPAPVNDPVSPYRPNFKVVHRADPEALVDRGSHAVASDGLEPLPGLFPIEVLHFPVRSCGQMLEKYTTWWEQLAGIGGRAKYRRGGYEPSAAGRAAAYYEALAVDGGELEAGLAAGLLVEDTRLRDLLRRLRLPEPRGPRRFALPSELDEPVAHPRPTAPDEIAYAVDVSVLQEADLTRLHRRLDLVERRLATTGSRAR